MATESWKRDAAAECSSSARAFSHDALNDHFSRNVPQHANLELSVPNSDPRTQKRNASSLQRNQMLSGLRWAWSPCLRSVSGGSQLETRLLSHWRVKISDASNTTVQMQRGKVSTVSTTTGGQDCVNCAEDHQAHSGRGLPCWTGDRCSISRMNAGEISFSQLSFPETSLTAVQIPE